MNDMTYDQLALAAISVWVIQLLKKWTLLPAVKDGADRLLRVLGVIAAMLSAAGILITTNWNGAEGTLSILVSGLTAKNAVLFVWLAIKSLVSQEIIWRIAKGSKLAAVGNGA